MSTKKDKLAALLAARKKKEAPTLEEVNAAIDALPSLRHVTPAVANNAPAQTRINDLTAQLRAQKEAKEERNNEIIKEATTEGNSSPSKSPSKLDLLKASMAASKERDLQESGAQGAANTRQSTKEDNNSTPRSIDTPKPGRADFLAKLRAKKAAKAEGIPKEGNVGPVEQVPNSLSDTIGETPSSATDRYGNTITYNKEQQQFIDLASSGSSCVLIGSAGTGKTTCMQGAAESLIDSGKAGVLNSDGHKYLTSGTPGIIVIAYTRRAVNNIKKVLPEDLKKNCITAHKLLEYAPERTTVTDPETGIERNSMVFLPMRNAGRPLPSSIHTIIVEESSMLSVELYAEIVDALGHQVQFIFLGDIQQLPPVFGSAILGFKLLKLPVVELTQVYRQALESPIIRLAHRILSGEEIPTEKCPKTKKPVFPDEWDVPGKLKLHAWAKRINEDYAVRTLGTFITRALDAGSYNVDEDVILIPFNKNCGTFELNRIIANHIARKERKVTYEVMAGFNKHYFSEGDKVLYEKEDAEIVEIRTNAGYSGASVQKESINLDYWGCNQKPGEKSSSEPIDPEFLLDSMDIGDDDSRVRQASHVIVLNLVDSNTQVEVKSAAEINALIHAYALTVHKAQGSEWRKVFLFLHQSHNTMLQRELLYTGITRAKEELYVICEPDSFEKGIRKQRITGNTLEEKAEFFKGKVAEGYQLPDYLAK
jgi:ATP-dependent exoDNAse (exonuclease V) alpha subunit